MSNMSFAGAGPSSSSSSWRSMREPANDPALRAAPRAVHIGARLLRSARSPAAVLVPSAGHRRPRGARTGWAPRCRTLGASAAGLAAPSATCRRAALIAQAATAEPGGRGWQRASSAQPEEVRARAWLAGTTWSGCGRRRRCRRRRRRPRCTFSPSSPKTKQRQAELACSPPRPSGSTDSVRHDALVHDVGEGSKLVRFEVRRPPRTRYRACGLRPRRVGPTVQRRAAAAAAAAAAQRVALALVAVATRCRALRPRCSSSRTAAAEQRVAQEAAALGWRRCRTMPTSERRLLAAVVAFRGRR